MILNRRAETGTAEPGELRAGDKLAGYRIEGLLGRGGMGTVYEATQLSLKRRIALKVIGAGIPIDATLRGRFRREGELQAVIDHPHILPVYEAGEDGGRLFIAMRLVHGRTLKALALARVLGEEGTLRILGDVADALDAAHAAGLVHRDVKPQNILIAEGDYAYLADFGLSRGRSDATLTRAGQLLGSVAYISPEQVRGERATKASDIYSLACVAFECLVGLVPFPLDSDHAILHAHAWDPPPRPSEIRPELPPALDEVIARAMAKDPTARPATARALIDELRTALGLELEPAGDNGRATAVLPVADDEEDDTRVREPVVVAGGGRVRRGRLALAGLLATLALLLGGSAGYLSARESGKPTPAAHAAARIVHRGPDASYGKRISAAFTSLNSAGPRLERELKSATTAGGQAKALSALADAFQKARASVAGAHPGDSARGANAAIERALGSVGSGYRRLDSAARRGRRSTYNAARSALAPDEHKLKEAVQGLERLGYRLR